MLIGFDAKRAFHNSSGLGNYSRDIIRMLCSFFPEHRYLLYNPKTAKIQFDPGPAAQQALPNSVIGKAFSSIWRRKGIVAQLKKDGIDLYHGLSNELPSGISKSGIVSIVTIHDLIFYKYPQWYKPADRIIHQKKAAQACREASHIVAISEQTKTDIIEFLKVDPLKISVIYQGCHPAFKKNYTADEIKTVTKKYSLPSAFLLSVGTIEPRKNLITTVKSLLHHDLPLVVVGKKTAYFNEVNDFIKEHKLDKRIQFLEGVSMPELAIIYRQAFVFCYPSIYEGFGIPIIESLFSNTPVISNKEGCFKEAGGPSGFYIDSFDEKAIAAIVERLRTEESLYQTTIDQGYEYVQRFQDEVIAKQFMELYLKMKGSYS